MIIEHYLQILKFYRRLLLGIVAGVTGTITSLSVVLLFLFPLYTAATSVTMLPTQAELSFARSSTGISPLPATVTMPATHIEYLLSRPVAERTLDRLLEDLPKPAPPEGLSATIEKNVQQAIGFVWRIYILLNSGKFVQPTPYEQALTKLMKGIDIEVVEDSYIMLIEVTLPRYARAAATAANTLADVYLARASEQAASAAERLAGYFDSELAVRTAALESLYQHDYDTRAKVGIANIEEQRRALLDTVTREKERLEDDRVDREALGAQLQAYQESEDALRRSGALAQVEMEMALSTARLRALERREQSRKDAIARVNENLAALAATERSLQGIQAQIAQLESEIENLRQQKVQVNLATSAQVAQLRVVSPATVPVYPSFPKVVLNTAIGFFSSVFLAFFVVVAVDTVSDSVKTSVDLRRIVGGQALGCLKRRVVDRARDPRWRKSGAGKSELEALGRELETRLAALGHFEAPLLQIAGLGSPALMSASAETIRRALATRQDEDEAGSPANKKNLPSRSADGDADNSVQPYSQTESCKGEPGGRTEVEYIGLISAGFKWSLVARRSPALVTVFRAGELTEAGLRQIAENGSSFGLASMSFVLVEK